MPASAPWRMRPTYARVLTEIDAGYSLNDIARRLNAENVPTSRGGRWYASTVRAIRDSRTATFFLRADQARSSSAKGDES